MTKHIMILTTLLAVAEGVMSAEIKNAVTQDDKEMIILMAKPEDKIILKDYLSTTNVSKEKALKVQEILKKMILHSESTQPMMTMDAQGE